MLFPSQHSEDLAIPHRPDSKEHLFLLHMSLLSSPYQKLPKTVYPSSLHCAQFSVSP